LTILALDVYLNLGLVDKSGRARRREGREKDLVEIFVDVGEVLVFLLASVCRKAKAGSAVAKLLTPRLRGVVLQLG